ncbi:MAG: oligopeptidase A [Gammaproteobacteria bacterium]|jgi:oligopeptidase A
MTDAALERMITTLPRFSNIDSSVLVAKLDELLTDNRQKIEALLAPDAEVTWNSVVGPFEELSDRLSRFWSPIGHLHGVADSEPLRDAYNEAITMLSDYASELTQSDRLASAFRQLRDAEEFKSLNSAQQKIIDNALRDFKLGGIDLGDTSREKFRQLNAELAQLTTQFSENVLDATQAWSKNVADVAELAGLPDSALSLTRRNAEKNDATGYTLTLDFPCYMPVMSYCNNRDLRREMYDAYVTRASDQGPDAGRFDNSDVIKQILERRHELAQLVGFSSYAEYSLATKMAPSLSSVTEFLEDLGTRSRPAAERDFNELARFAADALDIESIQPWDVAYCSEKLRQQSFSFSQEELRPYFPVSRVLSGLFDTVSRLFDITVKQVDGIDTWHPDVMCFEIRYADGSLRGIFYLDLYARDHKRGGAWMDECVVRRLTNTGIQLPAAYLTCNFTPPAEGQESQLTHDEVQTLFHEFGHGLHHLLTLVDYSSVSGINGVPWDGVELPSQFLENWAWEREALDIISGHVDSGEPIGTELFEKMLAAKNFQAGMHMVRQLEFALFDFAIHAQDPKTICVQSVLNQVRDKVAVVEAPHYNRFQHGFSHIFAGGYAAGYYSYKWAEVLSADAFSRFEDEGIFNPKTGQSFKECILERGGSTDLMVLFKNFRGREPALEPLLKQAGLST